jgi:hypothetical protein
MVTKKIFRKVPSEEFVLDFLHKLNFIGFHDARMFVREDISREVFEELLPHIEPYYLPCKAKRFLYNLDSHKKITVLRHLLRAVGHDLKAYEKLVYGVKTTVYQIINNTLLDLSGSYVVDFN